MLYGQVASELTAVKEDITSSIAASFANLAVQLESSLRLSPPARGPGEEELSHKSVSSPGPSCDAAAAHVLALRRVLGNESASIRGGAQGLAIAAFVEAEHHTLYVAGTGSGKSVLPLLAATDACHVTVLVIPYVALRADLHGRGLKVDGGQWRLWREVCADGLHRAATPELTGVVLVSPDEASTDDFRAWVRRSAGEGVLRRVVVDEAHVLLTESSFRSGVANLRQLTGIGVPYFLTTATLPIEEEPLLAISLGISPLDLVVIRGPVSRPNLSFTVRL